MNIIFLELSGFFCHFLAILMPLGQLLEGLASILDFLVVVENLDTAVRQLK